MRFSEITPAPAAPGAVQPTAGAPSDPAAAATGDPQAQAKMLAQQALDRSNRKKEIQDAIKQKQQELADLQKQLVMIK